MLYSYTLSTSTAPPKFGWETMFPVVVSMISTPEYSLAAKKGVSG